MRVLLGVGAWVIVLVATLLWFLALVFREDS